MSMKKCTACKNELPLEMFYKNRRSADGKMADCKLCRDLRNTSYRKKRGIDDHSSKTIAKNEWHNTLRILA